MALAVNDSSITLASFAVLVNNVMNSIVDSVLNSIMNNVMNSIVNSVIAYPTTYNRKFIL
jgi:hypothetical protein